MNSNTDVAPRRPASRLRRVLIVSPNFPPINAPDMQRARMALPYLRDHGWEPVVLAVAPEFSGSGVFEPLLEQTYPPDIEVVRVRGIAPRQARRLGLGSLWWRCGRALRQAGDLLLARQKFDLVFFTTTQFDAFTLGPRWRRRFGVPYVVDYQDPWINLYYKNTRTRPPGGWWKFGFTQWLARLREPAVVRQAAGIVSVSNSYLEALRRAYPFLDPSRLDLLPFGASPEDFRIAAVHRPVNPLIDFNDGRIHSVYVGRCGPDMTFSLTALFRAFQRYRTTHPRDAERIRFHFIGTNYAPPPLGQEWVMPVARAEGVAAYVHEHCERVPFFDALHYLARADFLTVIGSNDPSYNASKLFPYVLARRPLLLLFHENSLAPRLARDIGAGMVATFGASTDADHLASEIHDRWLAAAEWAVYRAHSETGFEPYSAAAMTKRLATSFDKASATGTP